MNLEDTIQSITTLKLWSFSTVFRIFLLRCLSENSFFGSKLSSGFSSHSIKAKTSQHSLLISSPSTPIISSDLIFYHYAPYSLHSSCKGLLVILCTYSHLCTFCYFKTLITFYPNIHTTGSFASLNSLVRYYLIKKLTMTTLQIK